MTGGGDSGDAAHESQRLAEAEREFHEYPWRAGMLIVCPLGDAPWAVISRLTADGVEIVRFPDARMTMVRSELTDAELAADWVVVDNDAIALLAAAKRGLTEPPF